MAAGLLSGGWVIDDHRVMLVGLGVVAAAATATVRCFFVKQNRIMRNSLEVMHRDRVHIMR